MLRTLQVYKLLTHGLAKGYALRVYTNTHHDEQRVQDYQTVFILARLK